MNKVFLVGNLGADPELRSTGNGISVCSFRIGVSRRYKDASGETPTDWINIVAWRQLGELCAKYLAKGRKVAIAGSLQSRSYEDKAGNKRVAYEVVADDVEFLTPRGEGGPGPSRDNGYNADTPFSDDDDISGFSEMEDSALPF